MTGLYCTLINDIITPSKPQESLSRGDDFRGIDGGLHNVGKCIDLMTVQEREAIGLFEVDRDVIPDGFVASVWSRTDHHGRPTDTALTVPRTADSEEVGAEMYRRLELDLSYLGHAFQMNETSRNLIRRAAVQASVFLLGGGQADDTKWHLPEDQKAAGAPFAWIASDNSIVTMLASQVIDFGTAVDTREMLLRMKARVLKDTNPIPLDYQDDKYWS